MNTESTLSAIDHTLEDWTVSSDAMRWLPDPVPDEPLLISFAPDVEQFQQTINNVQEPVQVLADRLLSMAERMRPALARIGEKLREAEPDLRRQALEAESYLRRQALEARRNRGTGPPKPRLDGRRR